MPPRYSVAALSWVIVICLHPLYVEAVQGVGSEVKRSLSSVGLSRQKRSGATPIPIEAEERDEGLLRHNEYRSKQNSSNMEYMTWNSELARMAQDYAEGCVFEHSSQTNKEGVYDVKYKNVGENLHYNTKQVSLAAAVDAWYIEIEDYDYDSNFCPSDKMCGHYTQVVWAKSEIVGCGRALCSTLQLPRKGSTRANAVLTGCNYGSRGNVVGARPFLQGPPCTQCDSKNYGKDMVCEMNMCHIPPAEQGINTNGTGANGTDTGGTDTGGTGTGGTGTGGTDTGGTGTGGTDTGGTDTGGTDTGGTGTGGTDAGGTGTGGTGTGETDAGGTGTGGTGTGGTDTGGTDTGGTDTGGTDTGGNGNDNNAGSLNKIIHWYFLPIPAAIYLFASLD